MVAGVVTLGVTVIVSVIARLRRRFVEGGLVFPAFRVPRRPRPPMVTHTATPSTLLDHPLLRLVALAFAPPLAPRTLPRPPLRRRGAGVASASPSPFLPVASAFGGGTTGCGGAVASFPHLFARGRTSTHLPFLSRRNTRRIRRRTPSIPPTPVTRVTIRVGVDRTGVVA